MTEGKLKLKLFDIQISWYLLCDLRKQRLSVNKVMDSHIPVREIEREYA